MVWSFSRLNSYYNCPYEWWMNYIQCYPKAQNFFAQFGSLVHGILEKYEKGELSLFEISQYYEEHFNEIVYCDAPPNMYTDIRQSYYDKGLDYLDHIDLLLDEYDILGVEKEVRFKIGEYDAVGYIDLLLQHKETGAITILDHKSGSIKILKNGNISKSDQAHFLEFKRQLYLYSKPVIEEYGHVEFLEWNLFKDRKHLKIEWKEEEYQEALQWAIDTIELIKKETEWNPYPDFYYCNYLCSQRENACEYKP